MSKLTFWLILFVILGLILSVLSATIVHTQPSASPWLVAILELIERLGDDLAIAAIVGGVIEQLVFKKELQDRARDFFVRYFGRLLPEELQRRLRDYLEISLIRTTWDITYDIEHWPDKAGYLKLTTEMKYKMENRSEEPQTYHFRYEVENSLCPEVAETSITGVRWLTESYNEVDLQEMEFVRSERGYQVLKVKEVPLPPFKKLGVGVYDFGAQSVECFKGIIVSPFWSLYPAIKTTFLMRYPKDVEVLFEVTFGETEEMTQKNDQPDEGSRNVTLWTITKPILPGQGFEVRCKLKPHAQSVAVPPLPESRPT